MAERQKITVILSDGKEVGVSMLPLGGYGKLFASLNGLADKAFNEWEGLSNDELLTKLPELIGDFVPEVAQIIEIGTLKQVKANDILESYGLADAVELLTAILITNEYKRIIDSVKKVTQVAKPVINQLPESDKKAQPSDPES